MAHCEFCGSKFWSPGETEGTREGGDECPNCGSFNHRPYKDQPSPVQDEMEMRDMPQPGGDDTGGNPLQEGIFKGNLGWKNREVRDESFASVKRSQDEFDLPGAPADDDLGDTSQPSRAWLMTHNGQVFDAPYPASHEELAQTIGNPENILSNSTTGYWNEADKTARITGHANRLPPEDLQSNLSNHYGVPVQLTGRLQPREQNLGLSDKPWENDWRKQLSPQDYSQRAQQAEEAGQGLGLNKGGPGGFGWDNPFMPSRGGRIEAANQDIYLPWYYSDAAVMDPTQAPPQPEQQEAEFPVEQMEVTPPGPPTVEANMTPSGLHDRVLDRLQDLSGRNDELMVNGMPAKAGSDDLNQHYTPYGNPATSQWQLNRQSPITLSHPDPEKLDVARQTVESGDGQPYLDWVNQKHAFRDVVQPQVPFSDPNVHRGVGNINPLIDGRPYRHAKNELQNQGLNPVEVGAKSPEELELIRNLMHTGDLQPLVDYKSRQASMKRRSGLGSIAGGLIGSLAGPEGSIIGSAIGSGADALMGGGGGGGGGDPSAAALSSTHRSDKLETPSSVPSIGEKEDDPEKVDQKEFTVGPDMHENLYDPSVEGQMGGATTEGGQGLDPEGKASKDLIDNLPTFLRESVQGNHDHPVVAHCRDQALAENPNLLDEDHDKEAVKSGLKDAIVDNFHKRHGGGDHESSTKHAQLGAAITSLAGSAAKAAPGIAKGAMSKGAGSAAGNAASLLGGLGGGGGGGASMGAPDSDSSAPPDTPDAPVGGDEMTAPDNSVDPDIGQQEPITGRVRRARALSRKNRRRSLRRRAEDPDKDPHKDPGEDPLEKRPEDDDSEQPEAEPSGTVDPQGKGVQVVIKNLPNVMEHFFNQDGGDGDPVMEMIDQMFQQEDPDWQDNADDDHASVHDFFEKLLGSESDNSSEHQPDDEDQHMHDYQSRRLGQNPSVDPRKQMQGQPGVPGAGAAGGGAAPGGGAPGSMPPGAGGPTPMPGGGAAGAGDAATPDPSTSMGPGGAPGAAPGGGGDAATPDPSTSMGPGAAPGGAAGGDAGGGAAPGGGAMPGGGGAAPMPGGGAAGAGDAATPDPSTSMGAGGAPHQAPGGGGDAASPDPSTSVGGGGAGGGSQPPGQQTPPGSAGTMPAGAGAGTAPPGGAHPFPPVPGMSPPGGAPGMGGGRQQQRPGSASLHFAQDPGMDPEQMLQMQQQQQTQQQQQQQQQQHQQQPQNGPAAQEQQAAQTWQALTPPPHGRASLPPQRPQDQQHNQQDTPAGVVVPQGMGAPMPQDPGVAQVPAAPGAPQGNPMHQFNTSRKASLGPDTPEQKAMVIDYLLENGRQDEAPEVETNPDKFQQELAQIQKKDYKPLPNEQADQQPQPAQEEAPPGETMPVPNMQVQQSMQSALRRFAQPEMRHAPGDNGSFPDRGMEENPLLSPAADQEQQPDSKGQQDSSLTWIDDSGQPLQPGQTYQMQSASYDIPDIVRVTTVRPDSISYEIEGEYNLRHETELTKEEADIEGITFSAASEEEDQEVGPEDFGTQGTDFSRQPGEGNTMQQDQGQDDLSTPHMRSTRVARPEDEFDPGDPVYHPDFGFGTIQQPNVAPPYRLPPYLPDSGPYHHVQFAQNGPMAPTVVDDQRLQPGSPTEAQWGHMGAAPAMMYDQDLPPSIPEGMTHDEFNQQGRPEDPNAVGGTPGYCPTCGQTGLKPDTPCPNCGAITQPEQSHVDWVNNRPEGHRGHRLADDQVYDDLTPEGTGTGDLGGSGRDLIAIQDRKLRELQLQLEDAKRDGDYNAVPRIQMMIDRLQNQLPDAPPDVPQAPPPDQAIPQDDQQYQSAHYAQGYDQLNPEGTGMGDLGGSGRDIGQIQDRKVRELQLELEDAKRDGDYNAVPQIQMMIDRLQGQMGQPVEAPQAPPQAPEAPPAAQDQSQPQTPVTSFSSREWLREGGDFMKQGGRSYTPAEQRQFITEPGQARNLDRMDLTGTHYMDDEHDLDSELFLGL